MQKWQYLFIEADWSGKGFMRLSGVLKVRWINHEEQANWKTGIGFHDYVNQLGEEGWDMVGFSFTPEFDSGGNRTSSNYEVIMKRPKLG